MNRILLFIVLLQSLSSVLCLNCSEVRQSKRLRIYTLREEKPIGSRSYWIYDINGREWQLYLTESNGQLDIDRFDNKSFKFHKDSVNRFSNYISTSLLQLCYNSIDTSLIACYFVDPTTRNMPFKVVKDVQIKNPLIVKTFSNSDGFEANQIMAYDRHNKNNRVGIQAIRKGQVLISV